MSLLSLSDWHTWDDALCRAWHNRHAFAVNTLKRIKEQGKSPQHTLPILAAYILFLPFAAEYYKKPIDSLTMEELSFKLILCFLSHLEQKRHNIPRTQNLRLAALKSFSKMVRLKYPEYRELSETILHIPPKRAQKF